MNKVPRWLENELVEGVHELTPLGLADVYPPARWLEDELAEIELDPVSVDDLLPIERPKKRSECAQVPRPCPFVSCKYHVYLEIEQSRIVRKLPILPADLPPDKSCVLDMVELDREYQPDEVAEVLGMTVAEVVQIEADVVRRLRYHEEADKLLPYYEAFREMG